MSKLKMKEKMLKQFSNHMLSTIVMKIFSKKPNKIFFITHNIYPQYTYSTQRQKVFSNLHVQEFSLYYNTRIW